MQDGAFVEFGTLPHVRVGRGVAFGIPMWRDPFPGAQSMDPSLKSVATESKATT